MGSEPSSGEKLQSRFFADETCRQGMGVVYKGNNQLGEAALVGYGQYGQSHCY